MYINRKETNIQNQRKEINNIATAVTNIKYNTIII